MSRYFEPTEAEWSEENPVPLDRAEAEERLGCEISPERWERIRNEFAFYAQFQRDSNNGALVKNNDKNNPDSIGPKGASAKRKIKSIMDHTVDLMRMDDYFRELEHAFFEKNYGQDFDVRAALEEIWGAAERLYKFQSVCDGDVEGSAYTTAERRNEFITRIFFYLLLDGVEPQVTSGSRAGEGIEYSDLTPYEQMVKDCIESAGGPLPETPERFAKLCLQARTKACTRLDAH
ncbi:hypothetical protein [Yunchengibacter salinarum]|uniref:hypothetical protein n=1 Tax=Yunchengibacter salinarum TaxID=3133399 RepID=UPI0035B5E6EE